MVEKCVSFCDLAHLIKSDVSDMLERCVKQAGYEHLARIYLGSNFCSRYFLHYTDDIFEQVTTYLKAYPEIKITLVVPIFSESCLEDGKKKIQSLLRKYGDVIDEITVNDYGAYLFVKDEKPCKKINVGRLLNKDVRDIRYADYFNKPHKPNYIGIDSQFFADSEIKYHEIDLSNRFIDLRGVKEHTAVYFPYCFVTVGGICEFASIPYSIEKKFRPNMMCAHSCDSVIVAYKNSFGNEYVKSGRAVYTKVSDFTIYADGDYRMIYEPIELLMEATHE